MAVRPSVITEQRREVTGVTRMLRGCRIIMGTRVWKPIAPAIAAFVNMKSEKAGIRNGQALNIHGDKRPSATRKEPDCPCKLRKLLSAFDIGDS